MTAAGILACDLAKRPGFAYAAPGLVPVTHGGRDLIDGPIGDDHGRLYGALRDRMNDLVTVHNPGEIWIEAPLPMTGRSLGTEEALFGLAATAKLVANDRGVRCETAHVGTVRSAVLGSGRADKAMAIRWCFDMGWRPAGDDEADALVLLCYAAACNGWRLTRGDRRAA